MNTFVQAVKTQETRTQNGMKSYLGTGQYCVDFFYKVGAMRGQDVTNIFADALADNEDLALRIALWSRDVREGAGERQLFRDMLRYLEHNHPDLLKKIMPKIPEVGRWDDLLVFETESAVDQSFGLIGDALRNENQLCAKWMPRENNKTRGWINKFCTYFGVTPKFYRKTVSRLTKVVEQQMCAKDWNNINFSHVPSRASNIYKKAFMRNAEDSYKDYLSKLNKGDKTVKVNASAIFPYDIIKGLVRAYSVPKEEVDLITAQWNALPNYVGDSSVLAMVDVSGSMMSVSLPNTNVTALDVALSLGLYTADKNTGPFKDTFLTFSETPSIVHLSGNIFEKITKMSKSAWGMNTDIVSAFQKILDVAVKGYVKDEDMPKTLLILSDMQFDECAQFDDSALQSVTRSFETHGYTVPKIVFWNLHDCGGVPAKANQDNVALVSGFSPSIMTSVLDGTGKFDPESIMLKTVMKDRYSF